MEVLTENYLILSILGKLFWPIIGIIASIVATWYTTKRFFQDKTILPTASKDANSYTHLNGEWHEYHITSDSTRSSSPFWTHHKETLRVHKKRLVEGFSENIEHPTTKLRYKIRGEIKSGRMVLTMDCVEDSTEFVAVIYPNLLSRDLLIGIWSGFDFQRKPTAAPIVLSRREMNLEELNTLLESQGLEFKFLNSAPITQKTIYPREEKLKNNHE